MVVFTHLKNLGGITSLQNPWVLSRQHMTGSENLVGRRMKLFFFSLFPSSSFFCLLMSPPLFSSESFPRSDRHQTLLIFKTPILFPPFHLFHNFGNLNPIARRSPSPHYHAISRTRRYRRQRRRRRRRRSSRISGVNIRFKFTHSNTLVGFPPTS